MADRKDFIRTRKAIWQAYLKLAGNGKLSDITVSKIIKSADVSRGTFYGHYKDLADLQEEIENDFCKMTLDANLKSIRYLLSNPQQNLVNIFSFFSKNRKMIYSIVAGGANDSFFHKCVEAFKNILLKYANTETCIEDAEIKCFLLSSLIIGSCRQIVLVDKTEEEVIKMAIIAAKSIQKGFCSKI